MDTLVGERRSELEITDEIDTLRLRIEALLDERRGRAIDGNRQYAWCCSCGDALVDLDEGKHTCPKCLVADTVTTW